ncbi:hypothetical protein [Endozoicomonas arenosclerae]|uniref:hypothetical protein n=1 Tax=Endozoicomonas arenosclerae TaxID=1633495 RepID=UPI00078116EE|nr:hypothetical protein [Endozoicomonas arenosclerae]
MNILNLLRLSWFSDKKINYVLFNRSRFSKQVFLILVLGLLTLDLLANDKPFKCEYSKSNIRNTYGNTVQECFYIALNNTYSPVEGISNVSYEWAGEPGQSSASIRFETTNFGNEIILAIYYSGYDVCSKRNELSGCVEPPELIMPKNKGKPDREPANKSLIMR